MQSNEDVKKALQDYVLVSVDLDKQPEVAKSFGARSIPLIIVFSPNGEEKTKEVGGKNAEQLIEFLNNNKS